MDSRNYCCTNTTEFANPNADSGSVHESIGGAHIGTNEPAEYCPYIDADSASIWCTLAFAERGPDADAHFSPNFDAIGGANVGA